MRVILSVLLLGVFGIGASPALETHQPSVLLAQDATSVPTHSVRVAGSVLKLMTMPIVQVVKDTMFDTVEECWAEAVEFNKEAYGTGFIMTCWPITLPLGDN